MWTLDPTNPKEEPIRHILAKIIIVGTVLLISLEFYFAKRYGLKSS